jgi:ADP-ribosylglycohydrolase
MRLTWVQPADLLAHEFVASVAEGRAIDAIVARWKGEGGVVEAPVAGASTTLTDPRLDRLAEQLLDELDALPVPIADDEPSTLADIAATWPAEQRLPTGKPPVDRVLGGWVGRAAGCVLGKPVEKIPRRGIREILQAQGRWPLTGYFSGAGLPDEVSRRWPWNRRSAATSLVEVLDGTPEDDDLNFALLALRLLATHGCAFTSDDVAEAWLAWLPAGRVFTAERVAYRNLLLGLTPPDTARRHNPFREWIGAQIRTDVYGWVTPGRPGDAAALAFRDAVVSHTRSGVYGAMWVAALCSAALVASDIDTVLDAAESVVPPRSRFADAVRMGRSVGTTAEADWERAVDALEERYGHLHWVHVLNNAALVAAALAHGRGDFARSVCAAVSGGWDTDSVGATVGSVTGALGGAARIDPQWTKPLGGRLHTSLTGVVEGGVRFDDLAARTLEMMRL